MMQSKQTLAGVMGVVGLAVGVVVGAAAVLMSGGGSKSPADAASDGGDEEPGGPPPASVRVAQVEVRHLQHRVPVVGRLQEVRRVTVTAEVEGKVTELAVDEGDVLEADTSIIAQIDRVWAELRHRAALAEVAAVEAQIAQDRSDLRQLEDLQKTGAAKTKEVEDARTALALNEARLDAAVAERDRAATEVQRTAITAPFDGAVSRKLVEVGQWVEAGDGVVELISVGDIDALIDVPERYVNALEVGGEVEVVVDVLDEPVVGRVVSVRPDGLNASRTYPVKVRLPNEGGALRAGMSVTAKVPISRAGEFITVPRDAVLHSPGGSAVWYAQATGGAFPSAFAEPVEVLFGVGGRYAVQPLPGATRDVLTEGKSVVVEGAERLFPSQPLDILNATAAAPADTTGEDEPGSSDDSAAPSSAATGTPGNAG